MDVAPAKNEQATPMREKRIKTSVTISPTHAEFRIMPSRFGDRQQGGHFTILYSA